MSTLQEAMYSVEVDVVRGAVGASGASRSDDGKRSPRRRWRCQRGLNAAIFCFDVVLTISVRYPFATHAFN